MQPDAPVDLTPNFLPNLLPNLSVQAAPHHPPHHPPADPYAADRATVRAVRGLLAGACPGDLPHPPYGGYGRWAHLICRFYDAWVEGGTPAVEDLHVATATSDPVYCTLMCGDLPPEPEVGAGAEAEAGAVAGRDAPVLKSPEARGWSMSELLLDESAPIEFVIDGLIPVGVTNIAGRPKIGKSWLALQLFVAASLGRPVLGFSTMTGTDGAAHAACERNGGAGETGSGIKAYYLALEDSKNRLIDRLKKVAAGMDIDPAQPGFCGSGSRLDNDCSPLSECGLEEVRRILEAGYKLLIIDTFSRFLGRGDQMDQQKMTLALGALQRLAFEHHAAVVLVDHHRKSARTSPDADPIDDIMGATAKAGVVDCAIGLYRRHNQSEAALKLCGRDFGDSEIALAWDPEAFCWERKEAKGGKSDKSDKHPFTLREQEAIDAVGDLGRATLRELATHLGQERSNLYTRLLRLCHRGALDCVQTARGCEYVIPAPPAPEPVVPVVAVVPVVPTAGHVSDVTAVAAHAACELDEVRSPAGVATHAPVAPVAPIAGHVSDVTAVAAHAACDLDEVRSLAGVATHAPVAPVAPIAGHVSDVTAPPFPQEARHPGSPSRTIAATPTTPTTPATPATSQAGGAAHAARGVRG